MIHIEKQEDITELPSKGVSKSKHLEDVLIASAIIASNDTEDRLIDSTIAALDTNKSKHLEDVLVASAILASEDTELGLVSSSSLVVSSATKKNDNEMNFAIESMSVKIPVEDWDIWLQDEGCAQNAMPNKTYKSNQIPPIGPDRTFYFHLTAIAVDLYKGLIKAREMGHGWTKIPKNRTDVKVKIVKTLLEMRKRNKMGQFDLKQSSLLKKLSILWGTSRLGSVKYSKNSTITYDKVYLKRKCEVAYNPVRTCTLLRAKRVRTSQDLCVRKVHKSLEAISAMQEDNGDPDVKKQNVACKNNFVWMTEYGVADSVSLYHKTDENRLFKWLQVKKSDIEGAGLGLFACRDFLVGELITLYTGKKIYPGAESIYSITNGSIVLDCKPFKEGEPYLGAHMANDPNYLTKMDNPNWLAEVGGGKEYNAKIGQFFQLIAIQDIMKGEELLLDYTLV